MNRSGPPGNLSDVEGAARQPRPDTSTGPDGWSIRGGRSAVAPRVSGKFEVQVVMQQSLKPLAVFSSASAAPSASESLPITPDDQTRTGTARRAGSALAAIRSRLALVSRRIGQPADTVIGPAILMPEDIRARYIVGLYGSVDVPASLRDPRRRW